MCDLRGMAISANLIVDVLAFPSDRPGGRYQRVCRAMGTLTDHSRKTLGAIVCRGYGLVRGLGLLVITGLGQEVLPPYLA
ncbi:MAG: hypothetical protein WHT09_13320 [Thermogutta sp.]